ncbi:MAG: peptidoglycan DD-metalloendopeptidase family protein [Bacteroidales bacterium]|nr:peptidoglycan DD-metalloendopeptidase family protein [Bacteroidales bacterium]
MKFPRSIGVFGLAFFAVLVFCVSTCRAQNKKAELEETIRKIEDEINLTNQLLEETRKSKTMSLNEMAMLQQRIRQRENLISTLQRQIVLADGKLQRTTAELGKTESNLAGLRKEYAQMVLFANKNRSGINQLMFIFASDGFNQAYRRMKYLKQYGAMRQEQIKKMTLSQQQLLQQKQQLENEKTEKQQLLDNEQKQQTLLTNEQKQVDQALARFNQKEKNLQGELRQKEQEAKKLQKQIEAIIAEEIKRASVRTTETTATAMPDKLMNLTPEEKHLSAQFTQNRKRLPWPVERGMITGKFGTQPHPVLKKVVTNNNGIDITCPAGSRTRAVFDGIVISVTKITPTNNAVILRHGDFFTVYSNLDLVNVKRGDQVNVKQEIGRVHTDKIEKKTTLHFEIWQGKNLLNPELWLAD